MVGYYISGYLLYYLSKMVRHFLVRKLIFQMNFLLREIFIKNFVATSFPFPLVASTNILPQNLKDYKKYPIKTAEKRLSFFATRIFNTLLSCLFFNITRAVWLCEIKQILIFLILSRLMFY